MNGPSIAVGVRTLRIVLFALVTGVLLFAAVASFAGPFGEADEDGGIASLLFYGSCALLGLAVVMAAALPTFFATSLRYEVEHADGEDVYPRNLFAMTLARAACFEGAGLLACIAYLLGHNPFCLLVVGFAAVGILAQMPSEDAVRERVDQIRREIG